MEAGVVVLSVPVDPQHANLSGSVLANLPCFGIRKQIGVELIVTFDHKNALIGCRLDHPGQHCHQVFRLAGKQFVGWATKDGPGFGGMLLGIGQELSRPEKCVRANDRGRRLGLELSDILVNDFCGWKVPFNQSCVLGTTANGLEPDRSGAREQVKDVFVLDESADQVE